MGVVEMICKINKLDLVMALSSIVDLVDRSVSNHHKRVSYIAFQIANEMNRTIKEQQNIILAGALHDIGALSLEGRLDTFRFEKSNDSLHAEIGYLFLKQFYPFREIAKIIRYHHTFYSEIVNDSMLREEVPLTSEILQLADRIDILIDHQEKNILGQVTTILDKVKENIGTMFHSEVVEAFFRLAEKEYFWFDIENPFIDRILLNQLRTSEVNLSLEGLLELAKLFSQIIDFRSRFTSTHSSGVAATAEVLAKLTGWSKEQCQKMRIAGYLHDLGKLAVPTELLEKPGKLTEEEYNLVKSHVYYTKRVLEHIMEIEEIIFWASSHHERLDGKGYPFHYAIDELNRGTRIMAVADIFTAITEDRPYREGMGKEKALGVLNSMALKAMIDSDIVQLLQSNYDEVNQARINAQTQAVVEYEEFMNQIRAS
ncbi:HD domain-containing phosphohydrolase [Tepidibacillus marianensis]|uniref:HD-GYP domain-containing protein n=1 Tax=Tepidibacillus marianensis TaxID=3131995 RepID=UPI0030CD6606